jgi:hypothetical protein
MSYLSIEWCSFLQLWCALDIAWIGNEICTHDSNKEIVQYFRLDYQNLRAFIVNVDRDRITSSLLSSIYYIYISLLNNNMLYIVYHISSLYLMHWCKYYSLLAPYSTSNKDRIMPFNMIIKWYLIEILQNYHTFNIYN